MPMTVTCPACRAKFSASERLRGKNVQCPKCSTLVAVSLMDEETMGLSDVGVLDVGTAAREAKGSASGGTGRAVEKGRDVGEILCPSCGLPVDASARLCTNCGYSFERSAVIKTAITAESEARVSARGDDFDFRGVRKNRDFHNIVLVSLEAFLLPLANVAYMVLTFGLLVYLWVQLGYAYREAFDGQTKLADPVKAKAIFYGISAGLSLGLIIAAAAYYYIGTWFNLIGMRLAAKLLRFDLPPDENQRMVGMVAYYNIVGVVVSFLVLNVFGADTSTLTLDDRLAHMRSVLVGLQQFMLPVFFVMEMFFFRLRVFETLLAMVLQFLTVVALVGFTLVLVVLIGLVYAAR